MDECELIYFVTTVACAISKCCPTNDITLLAAIFTQLGDTLATVLVKRELNENALGDQSKEIVNNIITNDMNNKSVANNNKEDSRDNNIELEFTGMNYNEIISNIIDQYKKASSGRKNPNKNSKDE